MEKKTYEYRAFIRVLADDLNEAKQVIDEVLGYLGNIDDPRLLFVEMDESEPEEIEEDEED